MKETYINWMSDPRQNVNVLSNIGEVLLDSNKINMLRVLNCDEKYKKKQTSDFELLAEWERILPLCEGNGTAALYQEECRWLEIDGLSVTDKWKQGNEKLLSMSFPENRLPTNRFFLDRFVLDFVKSETKKEGALERLLSSLEWKIKSLKNEEIHVIIALPNIPFSTPNPYVAEQAIGRLICNEKYKDEDLLLLLSQTVISLALRRKGEPFLVFHLFGKGGYDAPFALLSYMEEKKLFAGRVYLGIFLDTAHGVFSRLCGFSSERIALTPELILCASDFADGLANRLDAFFRLYPRGGVAVGSVLTDSPLYFVAERLLREALENKKAASQ